MDYKTLDELSEMIEKELKKLVTKGDLTASELEAAEKAVCLMEKIIMLREGVYSDDKHSMRMDPYIASHTRRDPMTGRYYDRGYSGHSIADRAVDRLEKMMDDASSEYERECIRRYISLIRSEE